MKVILSSLFIAMFLTGQDFRVMPQKVDMTRSFVVPQFVQVGSPSASTESQISPSFSPIKGSQQPTTEIPYGEIFNKESGKRPFYLRPEFGGLDGSDHRREVRPNAAGQRLDMDQYNRQVRPPVGP